MHVNARFEPTSLQPSNASSWRREVSLVNAERRSLDMSLLQTLWRPWECPADLLPWLAWGFSVDIWDWRWPEVKKRWVIANSIRLHRIKTTPAGIKEHVALTGAEVRKIIRPPARGYYRPAMTEAMRIDWLNSLPQIRIRLFKTNEIATGRSFWNGYCDKSFFGHIFMRKSRGKAIYGRRAYLFKDGQEVPVKLEEIATPGEAPFERVAIGGPVPKSRRFWGHGAWQSFFVSLNHADSRILTVRLGETSTLTTAHTGMEVVDIRPQRIAEHYTASKAKAFFGNKAICRRFYTNCKAARYLYDQISLHDGPMAFAGGRAVSFYGRFRFGIRPYTAELKIAVPMKRCQRASGLFWNGHWKRANMAPLYDAIAAVSTSKAARDRILIDTTIYRTIRLSDHLQLGSFKLGELKRT